MLSQLGRVARRLVSDRLASHGLTKRAMAALAVLGESGAVSQAELGHRLGLDPSDVSALVDEMVADGRVERTVDAADRRRRLTRATARGEAALVTARAVTSTVDAELLAPLPTERRREIHGELELLLMYARTRADP